MNKEELYRSRPQLFKPGEGGRPKGTKNKSTREIREAISKVVSGKADKLDEWLDEIAAEGVYGKARAIELIIKLSEFVLPKLSKQEISGQIEHKPIIVGKPKDLELPTPSDYIDATVIAEHDTNNLSTEVDE
jgi:hypothetical protein